MFPEKIGKQVGKEGSKGVDIASPSRFSILATVSEEKDQIEDD